MADHVPNLARMSLTTWTVVAFLVAGSAGAIWLGIHPAGSERVVVTTRAQAAFHTVAASDMKLREVPRSAIPPGAIRSLASVQGHYVLRPLGTGQVVVQQAVGPPATAPCQVVVPLPVDSASSARIHRGALVNLLIAPREQHGRAVVMRRVLVVDEQKATGGGLRVFLAVPRHRERAIALAAGRGLAILVAPPSGGT